MDISNGLCSNLEDQLSSKMKNLDYINSILQSPSSLLKSELTNLVGLTASPIGDITNATGLISTAAADSIPSIPNTNDIENILQDCGLLQGNLLDGLISPSILVDSYLGAVTKALFDSINAVLNSLGNLIEAPAAFLMNEINNQIKGFGFGTILSELDSIINCLDNLCGKDMSNDIDYVNNVLDDLSIDYYGNFYPSWATTGYSLSQDIIDNITALNDTLVSETTVAKTSLTEVGSAMESSMNQILDDSLVTTTKIPSNSFFG